MKALSVRQPWAYAIQHLGKGVENRTWHTNFRGQFLLHAGKAWGPAEREDLRDLEYNVKQKLTPPYPTIYRGFLVGVARIVDCVSIEAFGRHPYDTTNDWAESQRTWANGPFCFVLHDVRTFANPVKWTGSLGFFDVPLESVEAEIAALKEVA